MAETETLTIFCREETETRHWYVLRPSQDRDVETETTTLAKTIKKTKMTRLKTNYNEN